MGEQLGEASALIGVGMAVVFAGLLVLMVSILIVNRLASDRGKKAEGPAFIEAIETRDSDGERVAVLAVALARAMERQGAAVRRQRTSSGFGWSAETSRWAASGREEVMRSRGKAGRQWGRRSN